MKLMIFLLVSLLLATSVEAGNKKKCTKCERKFNKCKKKNCPSPSPPLAPPSPPLAPPSPPLAPPSPHFPPVPPAYPTGLTAWYCPGAFDIASGTWGDCSGNGNTAALSGSGFSESNRTGNGATSVVLALSGTTSSEIAFGAVIESEFTVCSVTRYTGGAKNRILQGGPGNWLHGHGSSSTQGNNAGYAGVAFYSALNTAQQNNVNPNTDWVVMCGTNAGLGSQLKLANGKNVGTETGGTGGQSLYVNGGYVGYGNTKSDFAIAEVVVWNRGLTDEEMHGASDDLIHRLNMTVV